MADLFVLWASEESERGSRPKAVVETSASQRLCGEFGPNEITEAIIGAF